MEIDWTLWVVAFLFFLPLHFGVPLLYLLVRFGLEEMQRQIPGLLLRGGISAVVGFTVAFLAWPYSKAWAATVLVLALVHPWLEMIFRRRIN